MPDTSIRPALFQTASSHLKRPSETLILRQGIKRIKLGGFVGGHKTERYADGGGTDNRADDGADGNFHRKFGDEMVEHEADGRGQSDPDQTADNTD